MAGEGVPSWEEVARDYGRFLYTVAYRLTGNRDDAEDLVQEVLLRVRRGLHTYRPGSMEGWLSRIATNVFLDDVRRRQRRPIELLPDEPNHVVGAAVAADDALAAETISDDVQAALSRLPDEFRVAVVLSDVVGLTYTEAVGGARGWVRGLPPVDPPFGLYERMLRSRHRWARTGVAALAAGAAVSIGLVALSSPREAPVSPPVARLVDAHAATASLAGDPLSQLVPAATPVSFPR